MCTLKRIAALATAALLASCGGGGDPGTSPFGASGSDSGISPFPSSGAPPAAGTTAEGAYGGTLTGSPSTAFQLLVLEDGSFWSMYGTATASFFGVAGFVQGTGTSVNGSFTSTSTKDFGFYPAVAGTTNATYNTSARTIVGTVSSSLGTVGFSGGPIADSLYDYSAAANLSTVSGSWVTSSLTGESVAVSISASGAVMGASSLGCNFAGNVAPRSSGKNVFNVTLTFGPAPCELAGQAATGIAVAYPLASGQTQLVVAVTDLSRTAGTAVFGTR